MLDMRSAISSEACPRCQKCDRWRESPEYVRDPILLWDHFPCPPPGTDRARLLLDLDWAGQLGPRDGCKALKRVSSRCKVDLSSVNLIKPTIPDCDDLYPGFSACGTNCVIAIVLACICLMFVLLLIVVCVRYVRRTGEAESSPAKSTLTTDQTALNTHVNRYYVHRQYVCGSVIPQRHALPFEARVVDNGVEARLLQAIQNQTLQQQYSLDTCNQCHLDYSRQHPNTGGRRHGYERIYWKDKDYLQNRVPSNESLHRKSIERHRSTAGSSSDMSHYYESISDNPDLCYNSSGRRSNNSLLRYYPGTNSINFKDSQYYGDSRVSDDDRGASMYPRNNDRELDFRDGSFRNDFRTMDSVHSRRLGLSPSNVRGPGLELQSNTYSGSDRAFDSPEIDERELAMNTAMPKPPESEMNVIKGYKYVHNEDIKQQDNTDESPSPNNSPENFEFEDSSNQDSLQKPRSKRKRRRPSSCSYNSNYSESTSLSDSSTRVNNVPRTNGSFYNRTSYGNR